MLIAPSKLSQAIVEMSRKGLCMTAVVDEQCV
jgi:hypothetical protein